MIKFGKATGEQETKIREEQDQENRKPRSERNRIRGTGNQGQRRTVIKGTGNQGQRRTFSGEQETKIREEHDQGN